MTDFVDHLTTGVVRQSPLGPVTLNQFQQNIHTIDALALREHFADGQHNALEVPWILGHINSGTTGFLFDTAYGGTTIARPATGRVTVSAIAGVIGLQGDPFGGADLPTASCIANVSDVLVASKPHTVEVELVSDTSIEVRTWGLTTALGAAGNAWALVVTAIDLAVHAQKQPVDASLLSAGLLKVRRNFLTEQATDWNSLARNQATVFKALSLEHASTGAHLVNRIAKGWGWFKAGVGSFSIVDSDGVASVSRTSIGVVVVTLSAALSSVSLAACFPEGQPADASELVIVNGYCTSTTTFTFYIYVLKAGVWTRDDRSFSAAMFGKP